MQCHGPKHKMGRPFNAQPFIMSKLHYNWWEVGRLLMGIFQPPLEAFSLGYGQIYKILCDEISNKRQYEVTIGNFLACICMDFVTMVSCSLGKCGKWVPSKHMYYVLQHVMFCGRFESFIHFLTWNCDEVCHLLVCSLAST
jgi:hypothetical protein